MRGFPVAPIKYSIFWQSCNRLIEPERMDILQQRLGVQFKDVSRLERALTHRSAATENTLHSNERLEFLGDSVLGLIIAHYLFDNLPEYSEGNLAKSKAYIVSEPILADAAKVLGLDEFVRLSSGESASGGNLRKSILADVFEALVAAIYLDCGLASAQQVVHSALKDAILTAQTEEHRGDYKSALQEQTQAVFKITPHYRIQSETGHEHDKIFTAEAMLAGESIGIGTGKSKKEAERAAALNALRNLTPV